MMKPRTLLLTCLLSILAPGALFADTTRITVIDLEGRTAEEMIPLVRPMLDPGGALSGSGYQLIVRTTPANLAQIQDLIERLDRPPRRLLIQLHRGEFDRSDTGRTGAFVEGRTGDVTVRAGERDSGGAAVEIREGDIRAGGHVRSTRTLREADRRQQVQTLEGQPAHIASGIAFPVVRQFGPYGTGVGYREASTGFYVKAELRGDDQVYLQVSPQRESLSAKGGGQVESSRLITTLTGPLDTWLLLGSSGETATGRDTDSTRIRRTRDQDSEQVWLRVQLVE